jgi:dephospho-CoA kinase
MIVAGLTGGIASGKSTVAGFLAEAGAQIVDADKIAREAAAVGTETWSRIVAHFGDGVLLNGGEIDRRRLGQIIFNDPVHKAHLNRIVHPVVMRESARQLERIRQRFPHAVAVMDVPLLIETGMHEGLTEIILVYVPEVLQLARLMKRDAIDRVEALARIRSQMPIEEKKRYATLLIDNSGSPAETRKRSLEVYEVLRGRAAKGG